MTELGVSMKTNDGAKSDYKVKMQQCATARIKSRMTEAELEAKLLS